MSFVSPGTNPRLRPPIFVRYQDARLHELPPDATMQIWYKPDGGTDPICNGTVHASAISSEEDVLLVCFAQTGVDEWEIMKRTLEVGEGLRVRTLLCGTGARSEIGSALWGTDRFAALHGGTCGLYRPMLFKPNPTLMQVWDIARAGRPDEIRNALLLLRRGRMHSHWVSEQDGAQPHDWKRIFTVVD